MKTIGAVVLAVIVTAVCFSQLPGSRAATVSSAPAGRYAIVHLNEEFALMLDTATGEVWRYAYGDFCRSTAPSYDVRQVGYGEQCKEGEDSLSHIPMFNRVSVGGLYKTPVKAMIDQSFQAQAKRAR
jgi:hypothetical protein